ncbi:hypothetical protein BDZ91DRAFT_737077 [Kalaharituber pfeilii]|nr:hypothetical protein BDZ91DRAFT_737077 [Kalaharituber pfeilii]
MGGRTSYTPTERTVVDEFEFPNTSDRASVQELQEALANAKKELGAKEDRIYELTNRIQELERLRAGDHKALEDQKPKIQEVEKVKARDHKALEEQTSQLQSKLDKLAAKHRQSLNEVTELKNYKDTISSTLVPTRVAIKSVAFERRYVSMNSAGVKSFSEGGGGTVDVEMTVHEREIFELERHPDDVVAFRGSCFPNVYIRADACGLGPGDFSWVGGGKVNFQYSCGEREKFRIHRAGDQGEVAIESVAFPGRYLRLDGLMQDAITLQGKLNWWEKFYLIFAP